MKQVLLEHKRTRPRVDQQMRPRSYPELPRVTQLYSEFPRIALERVIKTIPNLFLRFSHIRNFLKKTHYHPRDGHTDKPTDR